MATSKAEFVLTDGGILRRDISENLITNADALLTEIVASQGTVLPNLAPGTHVRIANNVVWMATRLKQLSLRTHFRLLAEAPNTPPLYVPTFRAAADTMEVTHKWEPRADMYLMLISSMSRFINFSNSHTCYLVVFSVDRGQFLLPLPNLYGDGRVCMGGEWDRGQSELTAHAAHNTGDYISRHGLALKAFESSVWNADLSEGKEEKAKLLFRFSGDGKQQPIPDNWHTHCVKAGSTNYDWVSPIVKEEIV